MPTLEETVYDLAISALRQQEDTVSELRSRTGTLLTASSLIASFLGSQVIARGGLSIWVGLALLAFGVSVVLSIYTLLPNRAMIFALDALDVYAAFADTRQGDGAIPSKLAAWIDEHRERNWPAVDRVTRMFELSAFALLAEIGFLGIALVVA